MKVIKLMQIKMVEIMKMTMLLMLIKVEAEIDGVDVSKREQVSFGESMVGDIRRQCIGRREPDKTC